MSNPTQSEDKSGIKFADLPLISKLKNSGQLQEAKDLLEELEGMRQMSELYQKREEEIKSRLADLQKENNLPGMRWGALCFVSRLMPGRASLDKVLLMENGVGPEVIAASMKQGKSYWEKRFKKLDE